MVAVETSPACKSPFSLPRHNEVTRDSWDSFKSKRLHQFVCFYLNESHESRATSLCRGNEKGDLQAGLVSTAVSPTSPTRLRCAVAAKTGTYRRDLFGQQSRAVVEEQKQCTVTRFLENTRKSVILSFVFGQRRGKVMYCQALLALVEQTWCTVTRSRA